MKVGFTMARFSMILSTRPSTAVGNPQASWVESSTLPNECAIGSHRNCTSFSSRICCDWIAAPSKVHEECAQPRRPWGWPVVPEV